MKYSHKNMLVCCKNVKIYSNKHCYTFVIVRTNLICLQKKYLGYQYGSMMNKKLNIFVNKTKKNLKRMMYKK